VKSSLERLGWRAQLVPLETTGDIDLVNPIYAMGVQGVFTKELDTALLNNKADIAVHSLKDVPTVLPKGLIIAAVLERATSEDILVHKPGFNPSQNKSAVIATSSIRRKSQWLMRFPTHQVVNVRGNVQTRLRKFEEEGWDGIIFAKAGLERLGLLPKQWMALDWMLPAPAQGAIAVVCCNDNKLVYEACRKINHGDSEKIVSAERSFLFHLEGGCSVPISALAVLHGNEIFFRGAVHKLDGSDEVRVEVRSKIEEWQTIGERAAKLVKEDDKGRKILDEFRKLDRGVMKD
jgi:hydroxymethylbilane synthase